HSGAHASVLPGEQHEGGEEHLAHGEDEKRIDGPRDMARLEEGYVHRQVVAARSDRDQGGGDEPAPDGSSGQSGAALGMTETEQSADAGGEGEDPKKPDNTGRIPKEEPAHAGARNA